MRGIGEGHKPFIAEVIALRILSALPKAGEHDPQRMVKLVLGIGTFGTIH
jgi:hypothetical protein